MRVPLAACLTLIAAIAAGSAQAGEDGPAFDCAVAATPVETAICDDPELAALDRELSALYGEARSVATAMAAERPDAPVKLREAQRAWLGRRDACRKEPETDPCIREAYRDRIGLLGLAYRLLPLGAYPVETSGQGFAMAPAPVLELVRANEDCDLDFVTPFAGLYDLDKGWQLWEIACWAAAYNAGSAFVLMPYGKPQEARLVRFEGPPEAPDDGLSLTFPAVDITTGDILSFHKGRGVADCGTYRRYGWDGRDAVRLLEMRDKDDCDGGFVDPSDYPLVFEAW